MLDGYSDHSFREPLTAEKNTESSVKKFTMCTVRLKERTKISGEVPQL